MTKKTIFISIFLNFYFLSNLLAKDVTLEKLINIAIENNSDIKISKYNEEREKAAYELSKVNYKPNITSNVELAYYDLETNSIQQDDDVVGFTLSASQLIYDFGKTSLLIDSSKKSLEASSFDIINNISFTVLNTKLAYYDILNKYQKIDLAKELIKIDEIHLNQAQKFYTAGIRTLIDVTDAELKLSNSKLDFIRTQYDLKNSKNNLISILGVQNIDKFKIKKDKEFKETTNNYTKINETLEDFLKKGLDNRAEIKMFQKQIESSSLQLESVRREYYPKLDLNANYSDKSSDEIASIDSKQASVGVYLKWDIYTGDSTSANVSTALVEMKTKKQQLFQQKLKIKEDITNAYLKVKENEESIQIALSNVDLATKKLDLADKRYKAGLNDLVELNESKVQYAQAKSELINTYYNYLENKANLDYATGIIY